MRGAWLQMSSHLGFVWEMFVFAPCSYSTNLTFLHTLYPCPSIDSYRIHSTPDSTLVGQADDLSLSIQLDPTQPNPNHGDHEPSPPSGGD
jgi:hypothetical protein